MIPVFLFLLLSLTALAPSTATHRAGEPVDEILQRVNANLRIRDGDIAFRWSRNADPCTLRGCMWPKQGGRVTIPVDISSGFDRIGRLIIIRALLSLMRSTCIRFVLKNWNHKDFIHFFSGSGCWSYVGRQGGEQYISLQKNGCLYTGVVQHEVLHALGFQHEQVRSDRDKYVTIIYNNIAPGRLHNFRKVATNNLRTPYDYNSVMHYSRFAFSKRYGVLPTIVPKRNPNIKIGGATRMSSNDIRRVNTLYRCGK